MVNLESRLTITAIVLFSISFWILVTLIVDFFLYSPEKAMNAFENEVEGKYIPVERSRASRFKYHYVAALVVKKHKNQLLDLRICETSILNHLWAITGGHCLRVFEKFENEQITIRSNSHDWLKGREHRIEKYVLHEDFEQNLALIRVQEPFFGSRITYIEMPNTSSYQIKPQSTATAVGWEIHTRNGTSGDFHKLKKTVAVVRGNEFCKKMHPELKTNNNNSNFCATVHSVYEVLVCVIEPGGSLIQNHKLIGISLSREKCAVNEPPVIYVNVARFSEYVRRIIDAEEGAVDGRFTSVGIVYVD